MENEQVVLFQQRPLGQASCIRNITQDQHVNHPTKALDLNYPALITQDRVQNAEAQRRRAFIRDLQTARDPMSTATTTPKMGGYRNASCNQAKVALRCIRYSCNHARPNSQ